MIRAWSPERCANLRQILTVTRLLFPANDDIIAPYLDNLSRGAGPV